jgi:peptidoglycan-N-acetylglucosamine deacetylase
MISAKKIVTGVVLLIFGSILLLFCLFHISKSRTFQFFGELTHRVETNEKVVALTFDDAPTEWTTEVLRILEEKEVKATFYVIGENIEKYPNITKAIVEQGHELGNHSYSHQRMILRGGWPAFVASEIARTSALIRDAGYDGGITFRPPNGKKLFGLPWYLSRNDIRTVMWDVEPDTYYQGDVEEIVRYTIDATRSGSIVLMHPFCEETCAADREALPRIIDALRGDGYVFVTIHELLEYQGSSE